MNDGRKPNNVPGGRVRFSRLEPPVPGYQVVVDSGRLMAGFAFAAFALLLVHSVIAVYRYRIAELDWVLWR